ncbi:hypothetical protein SAMN00017477_1019 [Peptoniphilus asaccharolyticus DSM 20463]|uniref:Uncharacterized protein n=1 Tax=Peptoniphilus asaccharolyticus DSM 20463 TaxID=573058 RepID=A0A1W1V173_PEPAS|nr:hypothetical protein [Peptoniphilus asaccharolyticus]MBL7575515.1 hypothetical protein [Peptoniphilus asaccharolyticus]SMB87107.1 hypothetical protein SAMN00017477_1019 [Peptoniphilus asaccharolyticus DSM 20463]
MNKGYDFYIDDLLLPITPSKINTKIKNKNKVITLLNGEELNLLKKPGLTEFNFECRIPSEEFPSVKEFISPHSVLNKLERLKVEKKTFQFKILRSKYQNNLNDSINKAVSLEDYEILEDAENGMDLIVSIFLKQYIPLKTKIINVNADKNSKLEASEGNVQMKASNKFDSSLASNVIHGLKENVFKFLDTVIGVKR